MDTDAEMKNIYWASLKEAEKELSGMDSRRRALLATVAALRRLVGDDQLALDSPPGDGSEPERTNIAIAVPPEFFRDMTPTQGYRALKERWSGDYKPPQMVDAFLAGGMKAKSRTALLAQLHSVLRRERVKALKEGVNPFDLLGDVTPPAGVIR